MAQTILAVDDEKDIAELLKYYFTKQGYQVITALNGRQALKFAEKKPDLILLDINLPDIDGLSICEKIRNFVSCPIIFLTARIEDSDKIKGLCRRRRRLCDQTVFYGRTRRQSRGASAQRTAPRRRHRVSLR